ncbi:MAG: LysM peptidoglycan-binding domain-containing protein [Polyangiales bacterium]
MIGGIGVSRAFLVLVLVLCMGVPAAAQRKHTVKEGQTLGAIAKRYRVSVTNLAAANRLKKTSSLRVGQVLRVPPKGVVFVYPGQTLIGIAKLNKVSVKALAGANGLKRDASLRVGQRLELPGYRAKAEETQADNKTLSGTVILERPASKETLRVRLFDSRGRVNVKGRQSLARFLRDRESGDVRRPHPRLMRTLTRVSDHFNGRTIIVVSAYRSAKNGESKTSRHSTGEAIDIRVEGVPNEVLRDYCLTLERVGVGYYPRSSFIHIDVRPQAAYWVDWSRPGEPALYLPPGQQPQQFDAGVPTAVSPK